MLTCPPRRQYKDTSKFLQWTFPFSYANLIPTAQSNSSPVSPESWKTSGIHLDFSPSVGQSHSDASGTETMLCMCHCVAHLCIEMVSNGASRVGFSGNDLPLIWWRYVFVRTELRIVEKSQVKTLTFKSRSCLQLRLCERWPSSTEKLTWPQQAVFFFFYFVFNSWDLKMKRQKTDWVSFHMYDTHPSRQADRLTHASLLSWKTSLQDTLTCQSLNIIDFLLRYKKKVLNPSIDATSL